MTEKELPEQFTTALNRSREEDFDDEIDDAYTPTPGDRLESEEDSSLRLSTQETVTESMRVSK